MLLEDLHLIPPKVLGTLAGRFFANFANDFISKSRALDQHFIYEVDLYLGSPDMQLLIFTGFQQPRRPPAAGALAKRLLKKHKLDMVGASTSLDDEDGAGWTTAVTVVVSSFADKKDLDLVYKATKAAFEAGIDDFKHKVYD